MFQGLSALFFVSCCLLFLGAMFHSGGLIIFGFFALAISAGTNIFLESNKKRKRRR